MIINLHDILNDLSLLAQGRRITISIMHTFHLRRNQKEIYQLVQSFQGEAELGRCNHFSLSIHTLNFGTLSAF